MKDLIAYINSTTNNRFKQLCSTFATSGDNICKDLPETEVLDGCLYDLDEDWWVFGFDTCHHSDSLKNWPREAVIDETLNLKKQLEEVYKGDDRN